MGAGASSQGVSDAEKVAMYDKLASKMPELIAKNAIKQDEIQSILEEKAKVEKVATEAAPVEENPGSELNLDVMFAEFCAIYRSDTMTNTIFAKFCNDSKLVDKKFPKPSIDMVWSKCAGKEKKISIGTFRKMLEEIAKTKGISHEALLKHLTKNAQVKNSGTKGESRFYDDKNTWTGVACKGGPTNSDRRPSLSDLADRDNKADVRGVVQEAAS